MTKFIAAVAIAASIAAPMAASAQQQTLQTEQSTQSEPLLLGAGAGPIAIGVLGLLFIAASDGSSSTTN